VSDSTFDALTPELREAHDVLASGAAQILPADGLAERLVTAAREQRPLRVKLGIDPSGSQLTLGHAVVLRKLRQFQDFGHLAVLVVGGFTGQVGDPSGRTATRSAQTSEDVIANARGYFAQLMRILDPDRTEVVNNADWLGTMELADLLGYTRQITVAQLLERDDFARRFEASQPITLSEFFYPLLQGIDSVEVRADVELGGTDQKFNLLLGRDIQRAYDQPEQVILTVPLLTGTDGERKMSKSYGNYIGVTEPPDEIYGKTLSIPDSSLALWYSLLLGREPPEGVSPRDAKRALARALVARFHDEQQALGAEQEFDRVHVEHRAPSYVPEVHWPAAGAGGTSTGPSVHLPALLAQAFGVSTSEARRAVAQGGVKLDGEPVQADALDLEPGQVDGRVLQLGRRRFARVRVG
jgi:tyrosyl-tRNA synthetase